jgi:hypothetical protein
MLRKMMGGAIDTSLHVQSRLATCTLDLHFVTSAGRAAAAAPAAVAAAAAQGALLVYRSGSVTADCVLSDVMGGVFHTSVHVQSRLPTCTLDLHLSLLLALLPPLLLPLLLLLLLLLLLRVSPWYSAWSQPSVLQHAHWTCTL